MKQIKFSLLLFVLTSISTSYGNPSLTFDAAQNRTELFGPFLKYNFLSKPFSFGLSEFEKSDFKLRITTDQFGNKHLEALWPQKFLKSGTFGLYDTKSKRIFSTSLHQKKLKKEGPFFSLPIHRGVENYKEHFAAGLHFCARQSERDYSIEICSDKLILNDGKFVSKRKSHDVLVLANGKKAPKNAQINISNEHKDFELLVKFKSGLKIKIKEPIYRITREQLILYPGRGKMGIFHKQLGKKSKEVSFTKRIAKLFKEKNLILDQSRVRKAQQFPITDEVMEFSPFREGRSLQIFGLIMDDIPIQTSPTSLLPNRKKGTYSRKTRFYGSKSPGTIVTHRIPEAVHSEPSSSRFHWDFRAPRKGEFNKDSIEVKTADKDSETFHYSAHIFRGHSGSIALGGSLINSLESSFILGAQLQVDYWAESLFSEHPFFVQRWGVSVNHSQTFEPFQRDENTGDLIYRSTAVDLMARFSRGVRPLQSSLGVGLRYFDYNITGGFLGDVNPQLLGAGLFWHTAPIGLIDGAVSTLPFFHYPKWIELSGYVYPLALAKDHEVPLAFSFNARGRLLFARNWFLDGSINFHYVSVNRALFDSITSLVEGSLGIGYNF